MGFFGLPYLCYVLMLLYFSNKVSSADAKINFFEVLKVFPILHISYGLGYLKGILSFLILNKKPSEKQKELSR
jgi:hypothetical protein